MFLYSGRMRQHWRAVRFILNLERCNYPTSLMNRNACYVCRARVGTVRTPHGSISTPGFVGVGTHGTMKGLTAQQTIDTGLQLMFWYVGEVSVCLLVANSLFCCFCSLRAPSNAN